MLSKGKVLVFFFFFFWFLVFFFFVLGVKFEAICRTNLGFGFYFMAVLVFGFLFSVLK